MGRGCGNFSGILFGDGVCNGAFLLFKFPDGLPYQKQDLSVGRAPIGFGNIMQLVMEFRIDFDTQMLVLFISLKNPQNYLILSIFCAIMFVVYLK